MIYSSPMNGTLYLLSVKSVAEAEGEVSQCIGCLELAIEHDRELKLKLK